MWHVSAVIYVSSLRHLDLCTLGNKILLIYLSLYLDVEISIDCADCDRIIRYQNTATIGTKDYGILLCRWYWESYLLFQVYLLGLLCNWYPWNYLFNFQFRWLPIWLIHFKRGKRGCYSMSVSNLSFRLLQILSWCLLCAQIPAYQRTDIDRPLVPVILMRRNKHVYVLCNVLYTNFLFANVLLFISERSWSWIPNLFRTSMSGAKRSILYSRLSMIDMLYLSNPHFVVSRIGAVARQIMVSLLAYQFCVIIQNLLEVIKVELMPSIYAELQFWFSNLYGTRIEMSENTQYVGFGSQSQATDFKIARCIFATDAEMTTCDANSCNFWNYNYFLGGLHRPAVMKISLT